MIHDVQISKSLQEYPNKAHNRNGTGTIASGRKCESVGVGFLREVTSRTNSKYPRVGPLNWWSWEGWRGGAALLPRLVSGSKSSIPYEPASDAAPPVPRLLNLRERSLPAVAAEVGGGAGRPAPWLTCECGPWTWCVWICWRPPPPLPHLPLDLLDLGLDSAS
eukprot:gene4902-biopygen4971